MRTLLWSAAVTLSMTATSAATAASFCQRMAAELPMKEKRVAGAIRAFDMQTLTVAQRWLIGGTGMFSMKLERLNNTPEEERRVGDLCQWSSCTMEGPLKLTLGLKDGSSHVFEMASGERARVEMVGTRVRCSDL